MPVRKDRTEWSQEEDRWMREMAERGIPVPKQHKMWPAQFPPRTLGALRNYRAQQGIVTNPNPAESQKGVPQPAPDEQVQSVEVKENGDELVVVTNGLEVRTLDELVARAKVDLSVWEVDKPQTRMWEVKVKDAAGKIRNAQNFYLSCIFRRKHGPNVKEQVEALIAGAFAKRKPIVGTLPKPKGNPSLMQTIAIADPHIGKLAWEKETGQPNWDTQIAVETLRAGVTHLFTEGEKRDVAERRFALLGDYFQHDGRGMTTNGTVVDYDSRIKKMLEEGTELLFDLIAQSASRVPTKVYIVPGNHDKSLTYALQLLLKTEFRKHKGVWVDDDAKTTKFMTWGKCLIGMDHGDKGKTRLPAHMASACEVEWGQTTYREILTGHLHSKAALNTINGILVRTMDALCSPDLWHAEEKFSTSFRSIESLTYHAGGMCAHTDSWSPDLNRAPRKGTV